MSQGCPDMHCDCLSCLQGASEVLGFQLKYCKNISLIFKCRLKKNQNKDAGRPVRTYIQQLCEDTGYINGFNHRSATIGQ